MLVRRLRSGLVFFFAAFAGFLGFSQASAGPFTAGNLVVSQAGDGIVALNTKAAAVFLKEYTTGGTLMQTIALPTAVSGSNRRCTVQGSAAEGFLTLSDDRTMLTLSGYDANVGDPTTGAISGTSASTVNRIVARINALGVVDTSFALTGAYSSNNIRSAVSSDGVKCWLGGGSGGVRFANGPGASTQIAAPPASPRVCNIFSSQLYASAAPGGGLSGIYTVGTGIPETTATATLLPGFSTSALQPTLSSYDFFFADASTLYIADDNGTGNPGIQKWTLVSGTWTYQYSLNSGLAVSSLRSFCGKKVGSVVTLYAVTAETPNQLVTVTDTGSGSLFTSIASAPSGTAFKGIDFAPENPNHAPTLDAIPTPQHVNEGSLLTFTAVGHDVDAGQTLTYSIGPGAPVGASINPTTGAFTFTPDESQGGFAFNMTVKVTDNGNPNLSASQVVQIVVDEVNSAPTLSSVPASLVNDELVDITFTATATDPDNPSNSLTFTLVGGPTGAGIDPLTGVFHWTPTEAQGGNPNSVYNFSVRVTDNGNPNLSDTKPIQITVREANLDPTLTVPASLIGDELTDISFTATASDPDLPAQALTFSLESPPSGASINPTTGVFHWTPSEAQGPGEFDVHCALTDTLGGTDHKTLHITVRDVNQAPVIELPDQNLNVPEGQPISVHITAHDDDIPANAIAWSLAGAAPAGASINPTTGQFNWTPSEAQGPGTYDFDAVATDDGSPNLTDMLHFHIVVDEVNQAPVIDTPDQSLTVNEGQLIDIILDAHDDDIPGNILAWSIVGSVPSGAAIDASTGEFTWTPSETQGPGTYDFDVVVTDNGAPPLSDSIHFQVEVHEVNLPPVLDTIGNQTGVVGSPVQFTATASDPDIPANTLAFSLNNAPIGAAIDPNTGAFSWTPALPGVYTLDVIVSDGSLSDSETIQITVSAAATTQATLTIELQGVHLPIGTTLHRWLHVTLGTAAGGPNAPIEIDTVAAFNDADGPGGNPATAIVVLNDPQPPGGPRLDLVLVTDKLHTVATKIPLTMVTTGIYIASFTGANGLRSGDANNDNIVDITDFGLFAVHYGEAIGADTTINQGFSGGHIVIPHPDFTGDGLVYTGDYTFVGANFGLVGDDPPGGYRPHWRLPRLVISVKELLAEHVKNAGMLDLNKDGWVTMSEISEWLRRR